MSLLNGIAHEYVGLKSKDEGYCDDPYCTGHESMKIFCSCGWNKIYYGQSTEYEKQKVEWLMHVVEDLQKRLIDEFIR